MDYNETFKAIFRPLVLQILGKEENDHGFVRFSWAEEGQPGWQKEEDVCFLSFLPETSDMEGQRNLQMVNGEFINRMVRQIGVSFIFYGPNSWAYAQKVRDFLFLPEAAAYFRANGLGLIANVPAVQRAPELFNGSWWQRADLAASFYFTETEKRQYGTIEEIDLVIGD